MTRPLLLIVCLLAAGCGADEPAPVSAKNDAIAITVKDFRYEPQTIRAQPGRLRVNLVNRGRLAHTFRVERKDAIVAKISSLLPGDRDSTTFRVRSSLTL